MQSTVPDADAQTAIAGADITANILAYSRWPTELATIRLCTVGPSAMGTRLINRRLTNGRQMVVSRVTVGEVNTGRCDAVLIGRITLAERTTIVRGLAGRPILSLIDGDSQCLSGAMFCLRPATHGVTFDLNIDAVSRSLVRVDPRVLALARPPGAGR